LQAIYQWQLVGTVMPEVERQFINDYINKKLNLAYFKEIIHGVVEQQTLSEAVLVPLLERELTAVDPIEMAILRIAYYELSCRLDIPYRVVINEGVQLAKKFGSLESYKFINAILDKLSHLVRSAEITKV
jgi:N utilization substance protein B